MESHCALNLRANGPSLDALDPMFEKQQKAQVARIKIEAVSPDCTSMAPSLDRPLLAFRRSPPGVNPETGSTGDRQASNTPRMAGRF